MRRYFAVLYQIEGQESAIQERVTAKMIDEKLQIFRGKDFRGFIVKFCVMPQSKKNVELLKNLL